MSEGPLTREELHPVITVEVGPMAHGGHCVARHEGRVVFVRHAIPGETVQVALTEREPTARYWRGEVVHVVHASDYRRRHIWKLADSVRAHQAGRLPVGGAEFGHITDQHQRRLKAHVFRDTLQRIGGISVGELPAHAHHADGEIHVEDVSAAHSNGLHWRTRVGFAVTPTGALAMKPFRSNDLIELRGMPLAVEAIHESRIFTADFRGAHRVDVVAPGGKDPLTLLVHVEEAPAQDPGGDGQAGGWEGLRRRLSALSAEDPRIGSILLARHYAENAAPRRSSRPSKRRGRQSGGASSRPAPTEPAESVSYDVVVGERSIVESLPEAGGVAESVRLPPESFWQIHRNAPTALVRSVREVTTLSTGDDAADLYAGAGLFTGWAAATVGPGGRVLSIEAAAPSSRSAADAFGAAEQVEVLTSPVERALAAVRGSRVVVLDPPRTGAGARVVDGLDRAGAEEIIYVSCEPSSFARDAKDLMSRGFKVSDLRVLDLYPNTHHMESVARFTR